MEGKWYLEKLFYSTGPDLIDVEPRIGRIRDICVGSCDECPSVVVVEDGAYMRWWHLYVDVKDEWIHSRSWHVFLEPWERLESGDSVRIESDLESPSLADDHDGDNDSVSV